jgi:hypothetical protein
MKVIDIFEYSRYLRDGSSAMKIFDFIIQALTYLHSASSATKIIDIWNIFVAHLPLRRLSML